MLFYRLAPITPNGDKPVSQSEAYCIEVEAVADEIVMISEGRIVFAGTREELTASGSVEQRFHELAGGDAERVVA